MNQLLDLSNPKLNAHLVEICFSDTSLNYYNIINFIFICVYLYLKYRNAVNYINF